MHNRINGVVHCLLSLVFLPRPLEGGEGRGEGVLEHRFRPAIQGKGGLHSPSPLPSPPPGAREDLGEAYADSTSLRQGPK